MYVPKHYRETDFKKALELMYEHPFALVTTAHDGGYPHATHIPVLIIERDGRHLAEFHLPKHNPHYAALHSGQPTKIIFKGPDTYISSSWYNFPEVSTWNYQAVHLCGHPLEHDEAQLLDHLKRLTHRFEQFEDDGYELMEKPDEVVYGQMGPIRLFRMEIKEWDAAYKLSQKMDVATKQSIIDHLKARGGDNNLAIAAAIEQQLT